VFANYHLRQEIAISLTRLLKRAIKKQPSLYRMAKLNYLILKGYYPILLDYPLNPIPRYGYTNPPHPKLYEIINKNRLEYKSKLEKFLKLKEYFWNIPVKEPSNSEEPHWLNGWIPGLDAVSLYSFLCQNNPEKYYEIGSGNSTKFARKAIIKHDLRTRITSIDPHPRTKINSICDTVIQRPLEQVDLSIFHELKANDVLFIDGSHRCFMNSDATVAFLDVLPRLSANVLVGFHDILLPYDYPPEWREFYFSEQYLMAVSLLAEGHKFDIVLPNFFVSKDSELNDVLTPIWDNSKTCAVKKCGWSHGWSFWIQTK
jgi:hypothetical protein